MIQLGNLQFDKSSFDFEKTSICGIFESDGYMTWYIEMLPVGEDNYIMFNALILDKIFLPRQLSDTTYQATTETGDLYEHTVRVNGEERFLQSVEMTFGKWDTTNQSIALIGHGIIEAHDDFPEVSYKFNALLKFTGINIFGTSHEATQKFVDTYLQDVKDNVDIKFEKVRSGLRATIGGRL